MIVYVLSEDQEYILEGSLTDTGWSERDYNKLELPRYTKTENGELTGFPTYTNPEYTLFGNIADINPNDSIVPAFDNNNYDFLRLSKLTTDDLMYAARGVVVKGLTSGAEAYVLDALKVENDNGLIIPSLASYQTTEDPYRSGEFIVGEKIAVVAGPGFATKGEHLLTKSAADRQYLSERGGVLHGQVESKPSLEVRLTNKTKEPIIYRHLDLIAVPIDLTTVGGVIDDIDVMQDGNQLLLDGDITETYKIVIHHDQASGSIIPCTMWFPIEYISFIKEGMVVQPVSIPYAPLKDGHFTNKRYVDTRTSGTELDMGTGHWSNNITRVDPKTGISKFVYEAFIPTDLVDNRWPQIRMYIVTETSLGKEYREVTDDDVYRVVITEKADGREIKLESWGTVPVDMKVVIN